MRVLVEKSFGYGLRILGFLGLIGICSVSNAALVSATSESSDSSSTAVNLNLVNGIAIKVLNSTATAAVNNLVFNLDATSGGSFSSNSAIVEVDSSNVTGYKLYLSSNGQKTVSGTTSYTTELVNTTDNSYTIPTLPTNTTVSKSDFSSGSTAGTSDKAYINRWGYSLDDTTYSPVPAHDTSTQLKNTNTTAAHDQTPVYVAMNVDLSRASGTYTNSLIFTATANPIPTAYSLSFDLNGGNAPSASPNAFDTMTSTEVSAQKTFTIPNVTPEKSGYSFTGWLDPDATAGDPGSSTNLYQPGDSITIIGDENYEGTKELTAQWEIPTYSTPLAGCNASSVGDQYYANSVLYIKLADNKCYTKNPVATNVAWGSSTSVHTSDVAATYCPAGTHLPTAVDFDNLLSAYGGVSHPAYGSPYGWLDNDGDFKNATLWSGNYGYWSATEYAANTSYAWSIFTYTSNSGVNYGYKTNATGAVVCMADQDFWSISTMQEMTPEICNSVYTPNNGTGSNITLVDNEYDYKTTYGVSTNGTRYVPQRILYDVRGADGTGTSLNPVTSGANVRTYTVRKLADGNCWMTEDLKLPLTTGTAVEASYGTTTASSISTFSYTPTTTAMNGNTVTPRTDGDTGTGSSGWRGYYYYSWYAATAEKGASNTDANVDVNGSICPSGWRLPANYSYSTTLSWGALTGAYLNTTTNTSTDTGYQVLESSPLSLQRSGGYSVSLVSGGVYGTWWSSTTQSTTYTYYQSFSSSLVYPQDYGHKTRGFPLRCLAVR